MAPPPQQTHIREDDALVADLHRRLLGVNGVCEQPNPPRRGDLGRALQKLGDVRPGQLLFATDFDGTLAPIVQDPDIARALPTNVHLLERLIDHGVHVAVISGRAQRDLRLRLPITATRVLGENGMGEVTMREGEALERFNRKAARVVAQMAGVRMERKPGSTSLHYRRAPDAEPELWAAVAPIANRFGLQATKGRMVIEVAPRRADKSRAVAVLIAGVQPRAVVYAGDDEPDHRVFRLLSNSPRRHLAIGVSSEERSVDSFRDCDLVVEGPDGMSTFLRGLLERVSRHPPS